MVLDEDAHAVLTDFGLSKEGVDALYGTKCHGMDQVFKLFGSILRVIFQNLSVPQGGIRDVKTKLSEIRTYEHAYVYIYIYLFIAQYI